MTPVNVFALKPLTYVSIETYVPDACMYSTYICMYEEFGSHSCQKKKYLLGTILHRLLQPASPGGRYSYSSRNKTNSGHLPPD